MTVVDASALIELLRATGRAADRTLCRRLETDEEVLVTEAVVMEGLAGAPSPRRLEEPRSRLSGFPVLHADRDFEMLARHTPLRLEPLDG